MYIWTFNLGFPTITRLHTVHWMLCGAVHQKRWCFVVPSLLGKQSNINVHRVSNCKDLRRHTLFQGCSMNKSSQATGAISNDTRAKMPKSYRLQLLYFSTFYSANPLLQTLNHSQQFHHKHKSWSLKTENWKPINYEFRKEVWGLSKLAGDVET